MIRIESGQVFHTGQETMRAERRDTPRIPMALEIAFKVERQPFFPSRTRDISLDGVFIETPHAKLPKKSSVEVALKLNDNGKPRVHRFRAQVTRVTPFGAGLEFDKADSDAYAALLSLVFSTEPKGSY
jgi:hypothetical protein